MKRKRYSEEKITSVLIEQWRVNHLRYYWKPEHSLRHRLRRRIRIGALDTCGVE